MLRKPAGRIIFALFTAAVIVVATAVVTVPSLRRYVGWAWRRVTGGATVEQRVAEYGPAARDRLLPYFNRAGFLYPPHSLTLIGIKDKKALEVWAGDDKGIARHIRTYPMLAASGKLGPKLREGDRQVPEGIYEIESLHPNSRYHLALRVNYPNDDDRRRAHGEGRTNLGGDIMIHGSNASIGCLAMGDEAAEDLFILVADTGVEHVQLILTPVDFRIADLPGDIGTLPVWIDELYRQIRSVVEPFTVSGDSAALSMESG